MHGKCKYVHFKDSNFEKCEHFLKWSDLGLVTEQVVFNLFRHRRDHFQKYDYALGFLFALFSCRYSYGSSFCSFYFAFLMIIVVFVLEIEPLAHKSENL